MGRTLLTAFAGSIGIIGIALILSLSTGVNNYIDDIQKSTMTSYPITISEQSIDLTSIMSTAASSGGPGAMMGGNVGEADHELDGIYSNGSSLELASTMSISITENNLTDFKKYLDNENSEIHQYIGENGIVYSYETQFGIYTHDPNGEVVNTDGSSLSDGSSGLGITNAASMMGNPPFTGGSLPFSAGSSFNAEVLIPGMNGTLISSAVTESYDVIYGGWPEAYDEVVLVTDENNEIATMTLYQLGILPASEYAELMDKLNQGEEVTVPTTKWSYEEICAQELYMVPACDTYVLNDQGFFELISGNDEELEVLLENALRLKIVGIIRPAENAFNATLTCPIAYTQVLTTYIIDYTNESAVVKAQEASPNINVTSGITFAPDTDEEKIADAITYLESLGISDKAILAKQIMSAMSTVQTAPATDAGAGEILDNDGAVERPEGLEMPSEEMPAAVAFPTSETEYAAIIDNLIERQDSDTLTALTIKKRFLIVAPIITPR